MTITNYKIKDFLQQDFDMIIEYMGFLENLNAIYQFPNPQIPSITCYVRDVRSLSFGQVVLLREDFNTPDVYALIKSVSLLTGLSKEDVYCLPILTFYGVYAAITNNLIEMTNAEENESHDDEDDGDVLYIAVNGPQRTARFGILNYINSIAGNDPLKWQAVEDLPYLTVFTWWVMNKTNERIQRDIRTLEKNKQSNN